MKTKYIKVVFFVCFKFIPVQSWWSKFSYQDPKTKHSRHTGFECSQGPVGVNIQGGVCLLPPTFYPSFY